MKPYIVEEFSNGILLFTINRPEKRNAVNYEIMDGLEHALNLANNKKVKVFAITGAGDLAFCSGGDLSAFHCLRTEDEAFEMLNRMSDLLVKLFYLQKPTVALLNGTAVGGGCELASACDFRIARKNVKAGFIQGTLAITTGWGGGTFVSEKLLPANAMKMLMEASLYDTKQLEDLGFVQMIADGDLLESSKHFLEKMLRLDVNVLKAYKMMFINKWEKAGLKERVKEEVRRCSELWEDEAHHKQVAKFLGIK
ncbi:enoyl-CoA hydratase/isomerase family protein [Bacillus sp. FJAT-49705]|uniref:Ethylmalonyl-CoA decarboxylase n=1 Tax=Cytobacillus citreus TaxID=2833586 RepID=A0ABS5NMS9_9BACI|nr:enoyl-CoA hydratase/isomerase family protein [Cytobacillus citreus]MBS4189112.1 enoyl-CoA hydratase/isomerase family protein [Cytobacillus citreus]